MEKLLPCPDIVRQLLRYDEESGHMFWRQRAEDFFARTAKRSPQASCSMWNGRHAGKRAFTAIQGDGYLCGGIFGTVYLAHRVAWCIFYGQWPVNQIDHKNRNRQDNRISNLRDATHSDNARNVTSAKLSSSQYLGVSWHKPTQKWQASIWTGERKKHLGLFHSERLAAEAYDTAAMVMFPKFANPNLYRPAGGLS